MADYITREGMSRLQKRMQELVAKRSEVIKQVVEAREMGDLSENAEYHAAREEQSLNEAEIARLNEMIDHHELVEKTSDLETVSINSKLKIKYLDTNEEDVVEIVSKIEAEPFEGKLSNESPIGNGLLGQKAGSTVTIEIPDGEIQIQILEILE